MKIVMSKLSDFDVRHAKPQDRVYKIGDGSRLWLYVQPTGKKVFRLLWRSCGKQKQLTIGEYPKITLGKARLERDRVAGLLAQGIDPTLRPEFVAQEQKLKLGKLSFRDVAVEWYEKRTLALSARYRKAKMQRLERYVFPTIGAMPIKNVKYRSLVAIVQQIEADNHPEMVRRVVQVLGEVFNYAQIMEYVEVDISANLTQAISLPPRGEHRAAITDPVEISQLLRDIDNYKGWISLRYAIKIMPYVFVRSQELRKATWDEINFEEALWTIPAAHMKKKREHLVPLSRQVIELLQNLKAELGSESKYIFPSSRNKDTTISNEAMLNILRVMGYAKDKMCIHGFRSLASTRLNEMGFRADVIEAQLAHLQENKVRAAYNRAIYFEERKEMMQKWADYLDELRVTNFSPDNPND